MDDDFFARVRRWCRFRGMTIEQMLDKAMPDAKTPPTWTYNGWRSRNRLPRADIALQIARQLGVTVEFLVGGEDSEIKEFAMQDEVLKNSELWKSVQDDLAVIPEKERNRVISEIHTLAEDFRSKR